MSFTPPDFSQILANEQTMNSRLTTLRNNLRAGLTNAGISYDQSDSISQLIDRYVILPIFQTDVNVNPNTAGKLGTLYKMSNISSAAWSSANNGNYYVKKMKFALLQCVWTKPCKIWWPIYSRKSC